MLNNIEKQTINIYILLIMTNKGIGTLLNGVDRGSQFVIFDGKTYEILANERIMMYLEPEYIVSEIYTDNKGNFAELFSCKIQEVAAGELTETVQIIKNNDTKMFEAVYDHETEEFLHAYDKYTYEEYMTAQKEYLNGCNFYVNINWKNYKSFLANSEYILQYIYPENTSKEQAAAASKLYSQVDDSKLRSALEKQILDLESDKNTYEVNCFEYYNNFDRNGKNELFVYRSVYLPAATHGYCYRDLWYTDGETVKFVMDSYGRADYSGVIELDNGPDLFYCVPEIYMGAPCQTAKCYIVSDGKPVEYVLPDENQYFAFDKDDEVSYIYIGSWDNYDGAWKIAQELETSDKPIQTFDWVDGEIRIVSGYGAE